MIGMIKILLSISACIVCISCNHRDKQLFSREESGMILPVNLDEENSIVSFYDLFERVSLIRLETNEESVIHHVDKVVFVHDSIFIMDKKQKTVFLFDSNGKYLNKLAKSGNGPDEYFDLADFTINEYTNSLEILSAYRGIYRYDLDFRFIERIPISTKGIVHRFAVVDSCTRAFYNLVRIHNIELYDIYSKELKGEYVKVPAYIHQKTSLGSPFFLLENKQKGEAVFTQPFSNTVYTITRSSFKPCYTWDFGKYNFSIDELKPNLTQDEYNDILRRYSSRGKVYSFLANTANKRFYLTQFSFGNGRHRVLTIIYDKTSGRYKKIKELKEGISFPYYPIMTEDYIYTVSHDTLAINTYLNNQIKKENGISFESYRKDQNPMILKYKLIHNSNKP
jgi:hypothetical protein